MKLYNNYFISSIVKISIVRKFGIYLRILVDFLQNYRRNFIHNCIEFVLPSCNTLCYAKNTSYLEDDSERADDVAKKNRSDIYKGSSQVRRRSKSLRIYETSSKFLFERCVSCMTLIPLLVWESFLFTSYQKRKDWVKWKPELD